MALEAVGLLAVLSPRTEHTYSYSASVTSPLTYTWRETMIKRPHNIPQRTVRGALFASC
jgi:hypothetical protein